MVDRNRIRILVLAHHVPVFEPVDLPVFEPFELKFEPWSALISQASFWPVPPKIPKSEAAADGGARGGEFEPAETERSHRPRAAALDHQTGDRGPRLHDGRRARQLRGRDTFDPYGAA
jgi:hypothetical protein